jgi:Uncharacterized conserved protein
VDNQATKDRPIRLFYAYSHRDEAFRRELGAHLSPLRRGNLVDEWHDRLIDAGTDWKDEIDRNLASADIVLLLVSADFIDSDYCWGEEMTQALARHAAGEARVVPVIVRRCRWMSTPLAKLQAVPKDGEPINEWTTRDAAFDDVAGAVEHVAKELREQRRRAAEEAEAALRREQAEAASASPARAPSPGARAPTSPVYGRGFRFSAAATDPRPLAGEGGAVAPGEGAAVARSGIRKHRSHIAALGAAIAVAATVGSFAAVAIHRYVVTRPREEAAERPKTVATESTPVPGTAPPAVPPSVEKPDAKPALSPTSPASPTAAAIPKPLDTFRDCPDCPEMVAIPSGSFTMGKPSSEEGWVINDRPQHEVMIQPFAIGKTEVTFDQWDACVAAGGCNGYRPDDADWGRKSRPVINVSWQDAQAFAGWLSKKTGKPYRLPTEAEWEYATRAGTTTPFSFGATTSTTQANYDGTYTYGGGSKGEYRGKTVPASSLPVNPWGLYEVHGNVWEWVEDCYHDSYHDSYQRAPQDGTAWVSGDCARRVVRGGSWRYNPRDLRSASRSGYEPVGRYVDLGFRVARRLTP